MRVLTLFVGAVFALAATPLVLAQDEAPPPGLARLFIVTPKAGSVEDFEAAIKRHMAWRRSHDDPWNWNVFVEVLGDGLGRYYFRSGRHEWADLDAYGAFLAKGREHWIENVAEYVESVASMVTQTQYNVTSWPEDAEDFTLISVTRYNLKRGMAQEFLDTVGRFHETLQAQGWERHYSFSQVQAGGAGPVVSLVLPYRNWAEFAGPDRTFVQVMNDAHGPVMTGNLLDRFNDCVESSQNFVLQHLPDLEVPGADETT